MYVCMYVNMLNLHTHAVINWTNSDVVSWLEKSVGLPQYADTFRYNKITGRHLPKIAINADQILQNVLLIVNSQHKQKIQLRAMDVVLFGPPTASGYWKDAMLVLSFTLSVLGVVYALRQRQMAQSKIDSFLDDFRIKEEELSKLKSKLELEEALNREDDIDGSSGSPGSVATPPQEVEDVVLPDFFLSRLVVCVLYIYTCILPRVDNLDITQLVLSGSISIEQC